MMRYGYALNIEGLKAGSVYALNRGYALNNRVHLTTRVYGSKYIILPLATMTKKRLVLYCCVSLSSIAHSILLWSAD